MWIPKIMEKEMSEGPSGVAVGEEGPTQATDTDAVKTTTKEDREMERL